MEHVEGGYCRCAACRKGRGEGGRGGYAVGVDTASGPDETVTAVVEKETGKAVKVEREAGEKRVKAVEGEHVGRKVPGLRERLKEVEELPSTSELMKKLREKR